MIRPATLFACIVLAAPAAAQATGTPSPAAVPTLKAAVTVASGLVRIGDLVDHAGPAADIPIFRAPDYGTTGTVSVSRVLAAIREHDLLLVDTRNLSDIAVTRAGFCIGTKEIAARVARAFAGRQNLGEAKDLVVELDPEARPILMAPSASADLQVARAYYEPRSGRFDIVFETTGGVGSRPATYRYTGTLTDTVEVPVLTRSVARGEMLRRSDVALERRPRAGVPRGVISTPEQAIGSAARQALNAGSALRSADLVKANLVRRDEPVTIVYEAPGLLLTMRGKAMDSGAEGDLVGVLNEQSKRTVQGYVSGPGRITIPAATIGVASGTVASDEAAAQQMTQ